MVELARDRTRSEAHRAAHACQIEPVPLGLPENLIAKSICSL
jgi:hypothetical protein